jgi:hypothetical protein
VVLFTAVLADRHVPFPPDNDVGYTIDPPSYRTDRLGR